MSLSKNNSCLFNSEIEIPFSHHYKNCIYSKKKPRKESLPWAHFYLMRGVASAHGASRLSKFSTLMLPSGNLAIISNSPPMASIYLRIVEIYISV